MLEDQSANLIFVSRGNEVLEPTPNDLEMDKGRGAYFKDRGI